ncbi:hypothetical protein UO65_0417 [Actinokineospora spheciospongiae]|uniref:Carrier domain-containing protein n=1 Tax=Actinokineospora spheciospongiae TaxID=909613 RepID=W7JE94_9PSEU|nr:acyl carrier protein [Actinokineospora spheciospongiae]EWC64294.1 hypothetical protein UO65_0417 [Actinokineospora spheciospongiae]PWW54809.1 acyl carrier protein [Actinokineospora spheciospongiae]
MTETFQKVDRAIVEVLPALDGKVEADRNLMVDLGIDSLSMVEILVELETSYGIEIPDSKLKTVVTVQDLLDLVDQH